MKRPGGVLRVVEMTLLLLVLALLYMHSFPTS